MLDTLPNELLLHVFRYTTPTDLVNLRHASVHFARVIDRYRDDLPSAVDVVVVARKNRVEVKWRVENCPEKIENFDIPSDSDLYKSQCKIPPSYGVFLRQLFCFLSEFTFHPKEINRLMLVDLPSWMRAAAHEWQDEMWRDRGVLIPEINHVSLDVARRNGMINE